MTNIKNNNSYGVIIPAAGIGQRFSVDRPKQYLSLGDGKCMLENTLNVFVSMPEISNVVVALHSDDSYWSQLAIAAHPKIKTVVGGSTRAVSVLAGLNHLKQINSNDCWVLVHDACRPYISTKLVRHLIAKVESDAVGGILAIRSTDTLKKVVDGRITTTVPRDQIWRAQTPQMFRLGLLHEALKKAQAAGVPITDESSAIEYLGLSPLIVEGETSNLKVTYPFDIEKITVEV